jgi:hypothetical protein
MAAFCATAMPDTTAAGSMAMVFMKKRRVADMVDSYQE